MSKYLWIALLSLGVHAGAQTSAGTLTTILNFGGTFSWGPKTGVIIGPGGVLYGTLSFPPGFTVYSLTRLSNRAAVGAMPPCTRFPEPN